MQAEVVDADRDALHPQLAPGFAGQRSGLTGDFAPTRHRTSLLFAATRSAWASHAKRLSASGEPISQLVEDAQTRAGRCALPISQSCFGSKTAASASSLR
jgi:hypothetical protein